MADTTFDDIIRALPLLTPQQRAEIIAWCKAMPSAKANSVSTPAEKNSDLTIDKDDWLAEAIGRFLVKQRLVHKNGADHLINKTLMKIPQYLEDSRHVRQLILNNINGEVSTRLLRLLGDACVKILVLYLEKIHIQVGGTWVPLADQGMSAALLMRYTYRLPTAIEGELPGYAANRMIGLILSMR